MVRMSECYMNCVYSAGLLKIGWLQVDILEISHQRGKSKLFCGSCVCVWPIFLNNQETQCPFQAMVSPEVASEEICHHDQAGESWI